MHEYEQLDLWRRGIALAGALHRAARRAPAAWSDRSLWDQISRASASIPANVAEGAQRGSNREFTRFLGIAMGSAAELHSLIRLAVEAGVLDEQTAFPFAEDAVALRRMAAALRLRVQGLHPRVAAPRTSRTDIARSVSGITPEE